MSTFHKVFFGVFVLIIIVGIGITYVRKQAILENHELTTGYYLEILRGVKTGGGIKFSYFIDGARYVELCQAPKVSCERILRANKDVLKRIQFPVVYEVDNPGHSEILLFASQYEKYNLAVPDSLFEVVAQLSSCE